MSERGMIRLTGVNFSNETLQSIARDALQTNRDLKIPADLVTALGYDSFPDSGISLMQLATKIGILNAWVNGDIDPNHLQEFASLAGFSAQNKWDALAKLALIGTFPKNTGASPIASSIPSGNGLPSAPQLFYPPKIILRPRTAEEVMTEVRPKPNTDGSANFSIGFNYVVSRESPFSIKPVEFNLTDEPQAVVLYADQDIAGLFLDTAIASALLANPAVKNKPNLVIFRFGDIPTPQYQENYAYLPYSYHHTDSDLDSPELTLIRSCYESKQASTTRILVIVDSLSITEKTNYLLYNLAIHLLSDDHNRPIHLIAANTPQTIIPTYPYQKLIYPGRYPTQFILQTQGKETPFWGLELPAQA